VGSATPKQYLELLGRTMLYHSVKALLADARIAIVFVVLARRITNSSGIPGASSASASRRYTAAARRGTTAY